MGSFRNYGHETRAITIVDRSLAEVAPGVYRGRVKIPVEGIYDIAFMMDSPQFLHCFSAKVAPNSSGTDPEAGELAVSYQVDDRFITVGEPNTIRFRLEDRATGEPVSDLSDVTVLYYRSDGRGRTTLPARRLGDGVYEANVEVNSVATYYVYVAAPSKRLGYSDRTLLSLMAVDAEEEPKTEAVN
jgi:hypothetical protein